jgi:hypothetical protein
MRTAAAVGAINRFLSGFMIKVESHVRAMEFHAEFQAGVTRNIKGQKAKCSCRYRKWGGSFSTKLAG